MQRNAQTSVHKKKLKLGMSSVKIQDKQVGKAWIVTRMGEHVIACQVAMERTALRENNARLAWHGGPLVSYPDLIKTFIGSPMIRLLFFFL